MGDILTPFLQPGSELERLEKCQGVLEKCLRNVQLVCKFELREGGARVSPLCASRVRPYTERGR